jgi:hypothetical protein
MVSHWFIARWGIFDGYPQRVKIDAYEILLHIGDRIEDHDITS